MRGKRVPTGPGEILREEFLVPARLTQSQLAGKLPLPILRAS
ncbi:MAG: hypothetical protein U0X73_08265 [Thermoanaerobaculia bacterium]